MDTQATSPTYGSGGKSGSLTFRLSHRAPLYFLVFSIFCQLIGIGVLSVFKDMLISPSLLLTMHALIAFLLARWIGMTLPWQFFNLLLAPGVILYTYLELPSGLAVTALALALLLYAPTFWTRVPYFPTHPRLYDSIANLIPTERPFRVLDLGCGMGRLLNYLADARPQARCEGVEISPLAYLFARVWLWLNRRQNARVSLRNFWNMSLADFDLVYAFLAPGPMPALWEKVQEELKPGAMFVTNTFAVEGANIEQIATGEKYQNTLYVFRRP